MIIPKKHAKKCDFCGQISTTQQRYLVEIKSEFKTEKIWESNRLKEEPFGLDGLRKLAFEIYGESNADDILNPKA
jgi:anion-transporting  ArsA/GET3 family ATPase